MDGFFEELKRRKVYRVAVGYIVLAGGIIQLASAVFPAWELPEWSFRLVVVLLLLGFPLSLFLSWAFDVTPTGIQATPAIEPNSGISGAGGHRRRNVFLLVAFGVLVAVVAGFFVLPHVAARKLDKSIAVLPFENYSDDKANAYFADGIQDDILTSLAKISDLKVISRTSVMGYRGHAHNVREIGKALGASAILEGSVRMDKKRNRVRVSVQLIDAKNDRHIWANEYDRDLSDVFAIQSDLAHEIAAVLEAKLSPSENERMSQKPTENGEAYLAYLQAHDFASQPDSLPLKTNKAEQLYERAIQLDPKFALAIAEFSKLQSWIYHSVDPTPARRDKALALAQQALALRPNLPEGHLALGYCYYYGDRNYERALAEFDLAQRGLPNNADIYLAIGAIKRRHGKWSESTADLEKAAALNPKDALVLQNLGLNYEALRNFKKADEIYDRGLKAAPQSISLWALKSRLAINWKGDFSVVEKAFTAIPPSLASDPMILQERINVFLLQHKFEEARRLVATLPENLTSPHVPTPLVKAYYEGLIASYTHDDATMRVNFERVRGSVEESMRENPDDPERHAFLGQILGVLGQKDAAIAEGKKAVTLRPESADAYDGPMMTLALAQIYAWTGETDQALRLIDHLLVVPNGITVALLKLDPSWDPLRKDPRFQQLLAKYASQSSS